MAEKIIITTDAAQKTIENINPAATNATLASFGEKIAAFTNGQYLKTDRVSKINCDTEHGGGIKPAKLEPTLTLAETAITKTELAAKITTESSALIRYALLTSFTKTGDGQLYIRTAENPFYGAVPFFSSDHELSVMVPNKDYPTGLPNTQTFYIGVTETDNFAGKEVAFTITA